MNDWELTDGEIEQAIRSAESTFKFDRAIATAAQKKLVEWLLANNQATESNLPNPAIDGEGINRGWSGYRIFLGELLLRDDQVQTLKAALGVK